MTMPDGRRRSDDSGSGITVDFRHGPAYARELARHPEEMKVALLVTIAGISGFVALLVASTFFVHLATPIRVAALVWFAVFGAIRTIMLWKRGAGRP
jgi:NhaP-type Na+/H+ or K+/H+ antiporter